MHLLGRVKYLSYEEMLPSFCFMSLSSLMECTTLLFFSDLVIIIARYELHSIDELLECQLLLSSRVEER